MQLSHRQQVVVDTWLTTNSNILIRAVAGSGKSTMITELLKLCEYKTLIASFNTSIQKEFEAKIIQNNYQQGKALTLHSIGLSAIKESYRFKINKNKNYELIQLLQNSNKRIFSVMKWEDKVKLSYTLMDMNDISKTFLTTDFNEIIDHMINMDKYPFIHESIISLWDELVDINQASYNKSFIEIDFNDMIYLPIVKSLYIPIRPSYLMVDECQDLNIAQHKLIDNLVNQGDILKWIAVGDPNQSIYGFSGAYSSSFELFKDKENTVELPLDICYRCPVNVVQSANSVYNVIEGFKRNPGIVSTISSPLEIRDGSMVICRNTQPLIELYFSLLIADKKVVLKGEDILSSIIKFLKPYNYKSIIEADEKMLKELDKLSKKTDTDKDRFTLYLFKENYKNFRLLAKNLSSMQGTIEDLIKKFELLFSGEGDSITLCTIHKAKGLEADVVYILNESLIPSKFAKSEQQLKQETNLKYVARTRAKNEMYFLEI